MELLAIYGQKGRSQQNDITEELKEIMDVEEGQVMGSEQYESN